MNDHGDTSMKKIWGTYFFFCWQNPNWDLKRCFIVPNSAKLFHKHELYGFQQEIQSSDEVLQNKKLRMYTNNLSAIDFYLELTKVILQFESFKNSEKIRLVFHNENIFIAVPKGNFTFFSAKTNQKITDTKEIVRINSLLVSYTKLIQKVDELITSHSELNKNNLPQTI